MIRNLKKMDTDSFGLLEKRVDKYERIILNVSVDQILDSQWRHKFKTFIFSKGNVENDIILQANYKKSTLTK